MLLPMQPHDIKHGYLYAVSALRDQPFELEPYLAVRTDLGLRFVAASMFDLDTTSDGPFDTHGDITHYALTNGFEFTSGDIWSPWSERDSYERLVHRNEDGGIVYEAVHPIVLEAERLLREEGTPDGQVSSWLRHSDEWAGSSFSALYNESGCLAGAFTTVYIENPYKLALLLRWLGVPKDMIARVTGIEKH